jgi:CO/xanthine dehydrogenase Mo-binding subunit
MPTRTLIPGADVVERALVVDPGQSVPGRAAGFPLRREGPAKLTGAAKYTDDLVFPGAWYGTTIRSTEARAKLVAIELDPDVDWSKVVVATAADVPGDNIVASIKDDQPLLVPVGGEIRHHAEPVALLAAADRETLRRLKGHIKLVTEPLEPVFDPELSDHVFAEYEVGSGDLALGFAGAALILEGEYRVGHQEQLYIENQAMIAVPGDDGGIVIHGSMQCPYYVHKALKRALRLTSVQARVIQEETGGGFGGKEDFPSIIALHASLLAIKAKRPVRMIYERHEDIVSTTKRHPAIVRHRSGFDADGHLVAQDIEVVMDGGAYCTLSPVVLSRGLLHAGGPYRCPNVRLRGRATRTNTAPNGAFRGFGAPQTEFAAEVQLSRAAERLGLSPAEIRRRNVYRLNDVTPTGQVLRESIAGEEVLERAVSASLFERIRERNAQEDADRRGIGILPAGPLRSAERRVAHGIGIALGWHGAGFTGSGEVYIAAVASVEVTADARIRVLTAQTEMGQGTKTVFPQMVAAELGVPADWVEYAPQDTAEVRDSGPTVASRTVMVVGGLVIKAAQRLRAEVEARNPGVPFHEAFRDDARTHGATRIDQKFEPYPGIEFDDATYLGDAYPAYGWAAAVATVEVDLDTCEVQVRDVIAVDDVGKVIHPILCEGQVEGGTLQAVGYAMLEEMKLVDGRYLNDRLATYLIPTAMDAPHIRSILVEAPFSGAPHGAKGVGELPMDVAAPAVVAAIHDATGVWIHDLPATPERILAAMHGDAGSGGAVPWPAADDTGPAGGTGAAGGTGPAGGTGAAA